ncbi:transport and Golgi organization protein 11-like [Mya arenaria]|uniref:transport and Golgi organization protein 11-like n=1 Tax=Mya arenaria TaxID=6604 RepID=UPI0022E02FC9|nr:transport and Golgi organization protein 11-like [Mya arenaria]
MAEDTDKYNRRSFVASLPSDYSDVQPQSYDPDFISSISNQMQVPDKIPVLNGGDTEFDMRRGMDWSDDRGKSHAMNVPERIMLAGGGHHVGGRQDVHLNFDSLPRGSSETVGLLTPPHTLTLDEQFPSLESSNDDEEVEGINAEPRVPNGRTMALRTPTTPLSDSLMLSGEDSVLLRSQLMKLNRRLHTMERQQELLANREKLAFGAAMGYFMIKFVFWFFRSK